MRPCGSCGADLSGEVYAAEGGRTFVWSCECGWACARTEASASDSQAGTAIARVLEKLGKNEG